jgi:hypothetical protein
MAFGVFIHRPDSIYDDIPSERYQFPKQYLSRVRQCEGDWIVYLEPSKVRDTRGYFAVAKVQEVEIDPRHDQEPAEHRRALSFVVRGSGRQVDVEVLCNGEEPLHASPHQPEMIGTRTAVSGGDAGLQFVRLALKVTEPC